MSAEEQYISNLNVNYTDRRVVYYSSQEFENQKSKALESLSKPIKEIYGLNADILFNKDWVKPQLTALEKGNDPDKEFKVKLLKEYLAIDSLLMVLITNTKTIQPYYKIEQNAGGVTEKVCLISKEQADTRLDYLEGKQLTKDNYSTGGSKPLRLDAIIKLPKINPLKRKFVGVLEVEGDIREVQREAIGLELARILEFNHVTESYLVEYDGQPGLLIPFGIEMTELAELAKGKPTDVYQTDATLTPLGEGIYPNQIIRDFGYSFGFFYLCNDPDAVGKNGQNKGEKANDLYIFDQVVMPSNSFSIDRGLNYLIGKKGAISRHFEFRNRTLIEDNSFEAKFDSLIKLIEKKDEINEMIDSIIRQHKENLVSKPNDENIKKLLADAIKIKQTLKDRIENIKPIFPKIHLEQGCSLDENKVMKDCLLLQKQLNKPVLFTDDGRPYRTTQTKALTNEIEKIEVTKENIVRITWKSTSDFSHIANILKLDENNLKKAKGFNITEQSLKKFNNSIFRDTLNFEQNNYAKDPVNVKARLIIQSFVQYTQLGDYPRLRDDLMKLREEATNKGFISHAIIWVDQKTQENLNKEIENKFWKGEKKQFLEIITNLLPSAFKIAVKLDGVGKFHTTCIDLLDDEKKLSNYLYEICALDISSTKSAKQSSKFLIGKSRKELKHEDEVLLEEEGEEEAEVASSEDKRKPFKREKEEQSVAASSKGLKDPVKMDLLRNSQQEGLVGAFRVFKQINKEQKKEQDVTKLSQSLNVRN